MKASQKPEISVVMAVHNGLPYLEKAARSILGQTYRNLEFIIVDDDSTDKSWDFLVNLKDKRVKLIKNSNHLGLAASLNKGLKLAKGRYIARMDADDISLPRRLETQLNFMHAQPEVDICGSWVILIDDMGNTINHVHKPLEEKKIKQMNKWFTGIVHPTWFAKRKVFEKLSGYQTNYDMIEDMEFLNRAKNYKMANINKELLLWRSNRNRRSIKEIDKMYKKSFHFRLEQFKKGEFGLSYIPLLFRSFATTYLLPSKLKIYLNKKAGLL